MVFVSDKSLLVIMFMYAVSFGVLTAQYVYADVYGITLKGTDGKPLKDIFIQISGMRTIANEQQQAAEINSTKLANDPLGVASAISGIALTLVELASGTYIFDIMLHLGVPSIFIVGLVGLYIFLLARAILGWIRGVF